MASDTTGSPTSIQVTADTTNDLFILYQLIIMFSCLTDRTRKKYIPILKY
ncbi:hypothetical protein HMPREF0645_2106 [Hallella bergensis DSM 17361]|uniref:Uncharacterized protein n=1 Tax=Hallella bergensis DSM 17361 TaxID=585502 RepID=D1PYS1_9BACT|nr:hypothetical protein HMPREF0645_2106 [Hallella bergensis DSM 17361]